MVSSSLGPPTPHIPSFSPLALLLFQLLTPILRHYNIHLLYVGSGVVYFNSQYIQYLLHMNHSSLNPSIPIYVTYLFDVCSFMIINLPQPILISKSLLSYTYLQSIIHVILTVLYFPTIYINIILTVLYLPTISTIYIHVILTVLHLSTIYTL